MISNILTVIMFIYFIVSAIIYAVPTYRFWKRSYAEMLEYLYSKNMVEEIKIIEDCVYGLSSPATHEALNNFYEKITQDEVLNSLKQKHLNGKKLGIKRFIGFCIFLFISVIIFTVILFLLEKFK